MVITESMTLSSILQTEKLLLLVLGNYAYHEMLLMEQ
jgi:hypothetical protein